MKKQIMSIAAAAALLTTGAIAFDYTYDGEIVADITDVTVNSNGAIKTTYAAYTGGVDASDENLTLSTNNRGDALIYPAFKAGDEWSSEIVVRNSEKTATVCKVVLYAADNSRELLDFDIYLSPYDVFRFNIDADGTVSTSDGSFAKIDPSLATNDAEFVEHNTETPLVIGKINGRVGNEDVVSGYAVIYAMVESTNTQPPMKYTAAGVLVGNPTPTAVGGSKGAYHGEHKKLLTDFRILTDICRDYDNNGSTTATWRTQLGFTSADIQNGTATGEINVTAPNVSSTCLTDAPNFIASDNNETNISIASMTTNFTSPSADLLFGDITIYKGGEDPRSLLIHATALDNFTAANQMMMWVPGEYAAIQDRRMGINHNIAGTAAKGHADDNRTNYSDYNLTGIRKDSEIFNTTLTYYTFDDNALEGANTLLVTQPTKRALVMAKNTEKHWIPGTVGISPVDNKWGEFRTKSTYYDENENIDTAATTLAVVISPVSGDPLDAYKNELQVINDPERTETASATFKGSLENGFAIVQFSTGTVGLPSIVSQMTGGVVAGESQINWIYSTTTK